MQIALATASAYRDGDPDLPLLVEALSRRGHEPTVAVWDDPAAAWDDFDAVVVRSCWDYTSRRDEFVAWAGSIPHLRNSADVIAWNTDKVYLRELQHAGVPVIPTWWNATDRDTIDAADEWVCKPSVSAGSQDTARWSSLADVYAHSAELQAAGRTAMVQPYIRSVDTEGETALLYIDGAFSHAIAKAPLLQRGEGVRQDRYAREMIRRREPTAAQRELADHVLAVAIDIVAPASPLLYARVDVVTGEAGEPLLIELELTEPSLFLDHSDDAADRFAAAFSV